MIRLAERRRIGKTYTRWWSRNVLVHSLRIAWILILLWCEIGSFHSSVAWCKWPDQKSVASGQSAHVMLIADTQIIQRPKGSSKLRSLQDIRYHSYIKRGWNAAKRLQPHVVIFMGDMLSSGRSIFSRDEYSLYHNKFLSLFGGLDPRVTTFYIPGNEDVGLSTSPHTSQNARHRYATHFGPLNQQVTLQNHTLVLLDAPGLVEEDYRRVALNKQYSEWEPISGGPIELVKSISPDHTIVFTHIPLSRPESASCGPQRERGTIRRGAGYGYQSTLGKQTSTFLLETLRPLAVYSADDRDYCEYSHKVSNPQDANDSTVRVREVTVKSFSPTHHIRKPGFQLLSIVSPDQSPSLSTTVTDSLCLLPDNRTVHDSIYLMFFVLTLFILGFAHVYLRQLLALPSPPRLNVPSTMSLERRTRDETHRSLSPAPNSATWPPWLPTTPTSAQGNGSASPMLVRTPNSLAPPQLRATYSPMGSPLLSSMPDGGEDDDEHGLEMHPSHYAPRRVTSASNWPIQHEWSTSPHYDRGEEEEGGEGDGSGGASNYGSASFFRAPRSRWETRRSWSWSFLFRGRRVTIHVPSLTQFYSLVLRLRDAFTVSDGRTRRRTLVAGVLADLGSILWPVVVIWTFLAWCTFA